MEITAKLVTPMKLPKLSEYILWLIYKDQFEHVCIGKEGM